MLKTKQVTELSDFEKILKKTKSFKSDTNYPYSVLGTPSDKPRVYISRLADKVLLKKWQRALL